MLARRLVAAAAVAAVATAQKSFVVNVSQPLGTFNFPILDCVGTGHAALALRADYREHLVNVQRDIGFRHIRGHGILDDDMSTFLGGHANLFNVFSIIDFYFSVGITPILELSFMPAALAYDPAKTIMHYQGITSAPKSLPAWSAFIGEMFQGLVDRYGDSMHNVLVEVWNEPQGCGFFCPLPNQTNFEGYMDLYNATVSAIKGVDKFIPVGGPATAGLAWVSEFITATGAGTILPIDALTTHSYPSDYRQAATRTSWEEGVLAAWANASAAGLPFVMTETSAGLDNNAYDAPFAASFIVHASAAILGVPGFPTLSFWTFTDIFEEPGFNSAPWAAKFGMQTIYGVPKPAYRGLQLLRQLPTTALAVTAGSGQTATSRAGGPGISRDATAGATATIGNVDVIGALDASLSTSQTVAALVTNYNYNANNAEDPSTGLPVANETVSVTFAGLPSNAVLPATASVTLLDSSNGWAKPVWEAAGRPTYPNATEIAAEMAASQFAVISVPITDAGNGAISVALPTLVPYAVALVRVTFEVPPA